MTTYIKGRECAADNFEIRISSDLPRKISIQFSGPNSELGLPYGSSFFSADLELDELVSIGEFILRTHKHVIEEKAGLTRKFCIGTPSYIEAWKKEVSAAQPQLQVAAVRLLHAVDSLAEVLDSQGAAAVNDFLQTLEMVQGRAPAELAEFVASYAAYAAAQLAINTKARTEAGA